MKPKKKGYSLIAAVFIMLVMSVLSLGVVTMVSSDAVSSVRNYQSNRAFYMAVAYAESYLKTLKDDNDWLCQPGAMGHFWGGTASISVFQSQRDSIEFEAVGLINVNGQNYERRLHYKVTRGDAGFNIFNQYVVYWAGGVNNFTWLAGNTTVQGSVFLNGDLGLGPMTRIIGDVHATGDVTFQGGSTVEGSVTENDVPPASYPTFDPSSYINEINIAKPFLYKDRVWGSQSIGGNYYYNGNLTIKADSILTVNAPAKIVVTGKVIIENGVKIGDNVKIISNQTITTGNYLNLGRNGLFYANDNLTIGNNSHLGDGTGPGSGASLISPKNVTFNSEGQFYGFVYAGQSFTEYGSSTVFEGNLVTSNFQSSSLNATFNINPNLVDFAAVGMQPVGGGTEMSVERWGEEY